LNLVRQGNTHEVAAAFFFGRENLVPYMFERLVEEFKTQDNKVERLLYYLNRHIELDTDEHEPLARELLEQLCGDNTTRIHEAQLAAEQSLESRLRLWDGVLSQIQNTKANQYNEKDLYSVARRSK